MLRISDSKSFCELEWLSLSKETLRALREAALRGAGGAGVVETDGCDTDVDCGGDTMDAFDECDDATCRCTDCCTPPCGTATAGYTKCNNSTCAATCGQQNTCAGQNTCLTDACTCAHTCVDNCPSYWCTVNC